MEEDKGAEGEASDKNKLEGLASSICLWDCDVFDYAEDFQLLTYKRDASILVKMQRDPRKLHVARAIAGEAQAYKILSKNKTLQPFIPQFLGHSTHLGVGLSCMEKESADFDDIGLQNLSEEAKKSALRCVEALRDVGVHHNDVGPYFLGWTTLKGQRSLILGQLLSRATGTCCSNKSRTSGYFWVFVDSDCCWWGQSPRHISK